MQGLVLKKSKGRTSQQDEGAFGLFMIDCGRGFLSREMKRPIDKAEARWGVAG